MTRSSGALARLVLAGAAVLAALPACASSRTPPPPPPPQTQPTAAAVRADAKELGPYLEMYPLGDLGRRKDWLAATEKRSTHLVQCDLSIPSHYHPERLEIAYVLTGEGRVYIEDRSYPAVPGSTFRLEPGVVHRVEPTGDTPLIALVWYEPPLPQGEDDAVAAPLGTPGSN